MCTGTQMYSVVFSVGRGGRCSFLVFLSLCDETQCFFHPNSVIRAFCDELAQVCEKCNRFLNTCSNCRFCSFLNVVVCANERACKM